MYVAEFVVAGDPAKARSTAVEALQARGFGVTWSGDWDAVAERGSKVANALLGAMSQYFKVGVQVRSGDIGTSVIRVDKGNSGVMGGVLGARRVSNLFEDLVGQLLATFLAAGVLVDHRTG